MSSISRQDDLASQLERALADVARFRTVASQLKLLAEVLTSVSLDEKAQGLLALAADVSNAGSAVIRLRDGDRLRARAAADGLEAEVAQGFSTSTPDALAGMKCLPGSDVWVSTDPAAACWSPAMRDRGLHCVCAVPLRLGENLLAVLYLATEREPKLSVEQLEMLAAVGIYGAQGLWRRMTTDTLEQALRARDDLLAVVAHDLRNPLNVISVSANSLMRRQPEAAAVRPIERIIRGAQRADRLIRDLLDVNAIEGGRFAIDRHAVETVDLILSALESQQSIAADASVILTSDINPDLPPLQADEERLLEVLENLVGNAVKFTDPGKTVSVGARSTGGDIEVWVKDEGCGIKPEHLPKLFDRFWQARKHDRRGTGLGLTICKAIVEAHGGRIWAESAAGTGTTMKFTIPVTRTGGGVKHPQPVSNILLVDDRPENLVALKAILQQPSYRLVSATSGEEALRLALREQFDVALIDVAMPGMDGVEVAGHMRALERCRDIPIIFVTAFGNDPQEIHRAYAAGGADYLVKPLDAEIVRKKVAVFASLRRRRQADAPTHR